VRTEADLEKLPPSAIEPIPRVSRINQSTPFYPISLKSVSILPSHLYLGL
jgi:hypothetical protein